MLIREFLAVARQFDRWPGRRRKMDVEEQHRTVLAADRRQLTRLGHEVGIRWRAVGDVDDDRRKSLRMLLAPSLDNLGCVLERGAHRSAPFPNWVEPDWKFHSLVHHSAGAIVRLLCSFFDTQRLVGQFTDRYQRAPAQFTAERRFTALIAVAQHTDMEVVVDGVRLGATDAQIMKQFVEDGRQLLGLLFAIVSAGKRIFHRLGLVDQKQETARILTTDFGLVCHGFFSRASAQPEDGTRACSSGPGPAVTDVTSGWGGRATGERSGG